MTRIEPMKHVMITGLMLWVVLCCLPPPITAKTVTCVIQIADPPPVIDGVLDDEVWKASKPITGFGQFYPEDAREPSEATELSIAYDQDYFYLAFQCFDSQADKIRATMTQRGNIDNDDVVGFAFDTFNSEREAYLFNVNPYGIPNDYIYHHSGYTDSGWDSDLKAKGRTLHDRYVLEIAIPFKSMRMPKTPDQVWGFYALRSIKRLGELVVWPPRTRQIRNYLSQASILEGLHDLNTGKHFTLIPYGFSSYTQSQETQEDEYQIGLDLRYGLSSNFMLDLTVNPDYSQIEADPDRIVLNERYAAWLAERRPFFTEGTDLFVSNQNLFYSRAMTNPIGGLKLTGKYGGTRIGMLSVVDDDLTTGNTVYYNHLRVKTELFAESTIGLLITNKDDPDAEAVNRVASVDCVLRFAGIYSLKAQVSRSFTERCAEIFGDEETEDAIRFEASAYSLNFERFGPTFFSSVWYDNFPKEFEAQSGLIMEYVGFRTLGTTNTYTFRKPTDRINEIAISGGGRGRFDFDNELQEHYAWLKAEVSTGSFWGELELYENHENYNGAEFDYAGVGIELWNNPNPILDHFLSLTVGDAPNYEGGYTGWRYRASYNAALKPIMRLIYETRFTQEAFYLHYLDSRVYEQTLFWNKVSVYLKPSMFIRGIYQYNSLTETADLSLLLSYEYSPLSNLFLGFNAEDFRGANDFGENYQIFVKMSYLWRI